MAQHMFKAKVNVKEKNGRLDWTFFVASAIFNFEQNKLNLDLSGTQIMY
jgi:hypothetical protein